MHRSFDSVRSIACAIAVLFLGGLPHATPCVSAQAARPEIVVASRSLQPGELVLVTVTFAAEPTDVRVTALGKEFPTFPIGALQRRALVGIDVEQPPGKYPLVVVARSPSGPIRETRTLIVLPKKFETRTLRVAPDFVDPPASVRERIEREVRLINDAYQRSATERLWDSPFTRPVDDPVSSSFGRRSVFNGKPRNRHTGADFASPAGTPIKAPNAGQILLADDLYFSGTTIMLDHGLGLISTFAHLSQLDVRQGDRVTSGQVIGRVGATGRVTGPHLHWALRVSGARVDPLSALEVLAGTMPRSEVP